MWQHPDRSNRRELRPLILAVLLAVAAASRAARAAPPDDAVSPRRGEPTTEATEFFETHIRPVLVERCYKCHSADAKILQGGLRLDTAERLRAGGDSGPVVTPHKPDDSLLISAIRYESFEMPPTGKMPDEVIADFVKWVELGAPDPRAGGQATDPNAGKIADARTHWAFQPPQRLAPPDVKTSDWPRSDVDHFILARLEAAHISPSPPAAPRALLRRLYYDLIGLPPTADELDEFAADPTDARYEAAVDRLLASPRFGERWARYWLDVARYSDTKGYLFQEDRNYKHAYTYRDWVIASFNADRPFDQFIIAQLAADQIDDKSSAPAIGFLTLGRRFLNNTHDIINDRIDVVSRGLMGLTVACARCHDHKFDPISADDYYAMYSVFNNSDESTRDDAPPMLTDTAKLKGQVVFLRGNAGNRGPAVERHFLSCLAKDKAAKPPAFQHGSGRREMAEAIASRDNPLTARVWVNRVWSHVFGHALVTTPSDFGARGNRPTHPELLDSLACSFIEDGWSTKQLVRTLVLSNTYRQASDDRPASAAIDPENQLLWRANRRRLDLEAMRDSLLVAAGRLDETLGGPSVELTTAPFSTRRSVYGFIERQNLPAYFRTFDFANPNTHTPERAQTVSPQQALFLLNSPFVIEQATHLAERSKTGVGSLLRPPTAAGEETNQSQKSPDPLASPSSQVRRIQLLYRCALGRDPTIDEASDALEFIGVGDANPEIAKLGRWEQLAQVLLMSNEFIFVD